MSEEREQQVSQNDETAVDINQQSEQDTTAEAADPQAARVAELEAKLAAAEATIAEQQDSVLRARAEGENARRRAEGEVEKARKFALERFASELLPVLDNLERAIDVADSDNEVVKPLLEGVEMTLKSFNSTVEKFGLTAINPQGEAFNPELHQAMSMQESADHEPNTVMAVMQKGYTLNGRLVRPAMVMVSRASEAPASGSVDTQA